MDVSLDVKQGDFERYYVRHEHIKIKQAEPFASSTSFASEWKMKERENEKGPAAILSYDLLGLASDAAHVNLESSLLCLNSASKGFTAKKTKTK